MWNRLLSPVLPRKPSRVALIAVYLAFAAVVARTFTLEMAGSLLIRYVGLEAVYLILFSLVLWKPGLPYWLIHVYFVAQCVLVSSLLSWQPEFDFVTVFLALLSYQAALFFPGRVCWAWILFLVLLTAGSLMFYQGLLDGLALALNTVAVEIVIPAYVMLNQETEDAKANSQALLDVLEKSHQQLKTYSSQVETLAATQERNHLARTLHDSVSQTMFSIALTARAAESLVEKEPARTHLEIARLQNMTAGALSQLRSLISEMRLPPTTNTKS